MSTSLPELIDRKGLAARGLSRASIDLLFSRLPVQRSGFSRRDRRCRVMSLGCVRGCVHENQEGGDMQALALPGAQPHRTDGHAENPHSGRVPGALSAPDVVGVGARVRAPRRDLGARESRWASYWKAWAARR